MYQTAWGGLLTFPQKQYVPIFQWSKIDSFPNASVHIYSKIPLRSNFTDLTCLMLPKGIKKDVVTTSIEKMKSNKNLTCVLVQIFPAEMWFYTEYIDTPFVVGLLLLNPFNLGPNSTQAGKFLGWDTNLNGKFKGLYISFYVIDVFFDTLCMIWGIYMLYGRLRSRAFGLNLATVCLSLIFSNVVCRQIGHILAILQQTVPYVPIGFQLPLAWYFLSLPFDFSAGIFLIFFWIEITSSSLYHGAFLDKAFWPSIVLVSLCFTLVVITSFLIMTDTIAPTQPLFVGLANAIKLLYAIISLTYFFAAYRVYNYTKNRKDPVIARALLIMMTKIIVNGVVMLIIDFLSFSFDRWAGYGTPPFPYVKFAYDSMYTVRSFLMIDIFGDPPRNKEKTTSNDNSGSSHSLSQPTTSSTATS